MDAAKSFMKGSGSFFIVESCTATDIGHTSPLPGERERLMPTGTLLETLLAMLQCGYDIVFVAERRAGDAEVLSPARVVDLHMRP
eukprot:gene16537-11222_t